MRAPVGVILAGGQGRRLGGAKATAMLAGQALLEHPLAAMRLALGAGETPGPGQWPEPRREVAIAVVAKPGTELPTLKRVALWTEPAQPSHPLVGLIRALEGAGGRAVLVCPVDLPFITPETLRRLAWEPSEGAPALLAAHGGIVQPLLGRWEPDALAALRSALEVTALGLDPASSPGSGHALPAMRAVAERLGARLTEVPAAELDNVNTPADLARAQARLISRT